MTRIAVVGLAARSPFGVTPAALFTGLCAGKPMFSRYEPFVTAGLKFPVAAAITVKDRLAGITNVAELPYPAEQLLMGVTQDAWKQTDFGRIEANPYVSAERIALVTGTSSAGIGPFCTAVAATVSEELAYKTQDNPHARYASATQIVAKLLKVRGPVLVVCSVCASGAIAIAEAAELLRQGSVDVAIAAGFDPLEGFVATGFDALGALTDDPTPFRAQRRGLCLGEAAAALVLVRESWFVDQFPEKKGYGLLLGWGASADAHHLTAPDPNGNGVRLAIERALKCANVSPAEVTSINAHGTGTLFNDAMEARALESVFGPRAAERGVYTVKGTMGHTLGAAGAVEAVVSLVSIEQGIVPPTVTHGAVDPRCDLNIVTETTEVKRGVVLSLSSAFGGANCALVLGNQAVDLTKAATEPLPVTPLRKVYATGTAVWCDGWMSSSKTRDLPKVTKVLPREALPSEWLLPSERITRADRVTQLASLVVQKIMKNRSDLARDELGIITASVLATAHTNERFELRRVQKKSVEPRVFPYTAPNAAAGEIATALKARGPNLTLVGGPEVGIAALERGYRWVAQQRAQAVLVIAVECPTENSLGLTPLAMDQPAVECCAAVLLEPVPLQSPEAREIAVRWCAEFNQGPVWEQWLSVGPLAKIVWAMESEHNSEGSEKIPSAMGAGLEVVWCSQRKSES